MTEQTIQPKDDRLLTAKEVAERWKVSAWCLRKMRIAGEGPAFIPFRNSARYKLSVIVEFEDGGLISKTELANRWGVTLRTIEMRDKAGMLSGRVMMGGRVRYRLNQIVAFEQEQTRAGGRIRDPRDN